jgi:diguanylate cyclase (GGDEF)-like protein
MMLITDYKLWLKQQLTKFRQESPTSQPPPFSKLRLAAKIYILLLSSVGISVFIVDVLNLPNALGVPYPNGYLNNFTIALFLFIFSVLFAINDIPAQSIRLSFNLSYVPLIIGAFLLPPPLVSLLSLSSLFTRNTFSKGYRLYRLTFDASVYLVIYGLGSLLFQELYLERNIALIGNSTELKFVIIAAFVALTIFIMNVIPVTVVIKLTTVQAFKQILVPVFKNIAVQYGGTSAFSILVAAVLFSRSNGSLALATVGFLSLFAYRINMVNAAKGFEAEANRKALEIIAKTDSLTELLNRRGFDEAWDKEIAESKRYSYPVSLIAIDIDYFKSVNDAYGHDMGDEILRVLGKILKSSIRDSDFIGRIGGEEISIALPHVELDGAIILAERLRKTVSELTIEGYSKPCTISLGVASTSNSTYEEIRSNADLALYRAKKNGRNRVES